MDYNNMLVEAAKQFEEDWQIKLDAETTASNSNNSTTSSGSNATDAGGSNKGPGGDVYIGTK